MVIFCVLKGVSLYLETMDISWSRESAVESWGMTSVDGGDVKAAFDRNSVCTLDEDG